MFIKDIFLAIGVMLIWGLNFVVIKIGLNHMSPFFLAGLRFALVVFPAVFFIPMPRAPLKWLIIYGVTISFGQFALLFLAVQLGMSVGVASLVIQSQAFFTMFLGILLLSEKPGKSQMIGALVACMGIACLAKDAVGGDFRVGNVPLLTLFLTLGAAACWAMGNIANKIILRRWQVPTLSLVVWSAWVPIVPFFVCSWMFEGDISMLTRVMEINTQTILSLIYLSFFATIIGYGIWGGLLKRYETWRVAPFSLLVPVVGLTSASLILREVLSATQMLGVAIIVIGLLINTFGGYLHISKKS